MRFRPFADESGFTLVEFLIAFGIIAVLFASLGGLMVSGLRTNRFAEQETASLDSARIAQGQIQRDLRSAVAADTTTNSPCVNNGAPAGYCLLLYYQSPSTGTTDQIRYRATQTGGPNGPTSLYRDNECDPAFTCANSRLLVDNLDNRHQNVPMFACDVTSSYPQISVSMVVSPLSAVQTSGTLALNTRARPRNIAGNSC